MGKFKIYTATIAIFFLMLVYLRHTFILNIYHIMENVGFTPNSKTVPLISSPQRVTTSAAGFFFAWRVFAMSVETHKTPPL